MVEPAIPVGAPTALRFPRFPPSFGERPSSSSGVLCAWVVLAALSGTAQGVNAGFSAPIGAMVVAAHAAPPVPLPPSTQGHPDEVIVRLSTGETLRGTITDRSGSTITLRHPVLGLLVIANAQVAEIRPAVERVGGGAPGAAPSPAALPASMVPAPASPQSPAPAQQPGALQQLSVPPSSVTPPGPLAPPAVARAEKDSLPLGPIGAEAEDLQPVRPPLLPPGWTPAMGTPVRPARGPWRATIAAAVNYTDNNDTSVDARIAAGAEYRVETVETLTLGAEYFFQTLNSNTTDNNLLVNAVYDRYIEHTPWLWFLKAQYQYSQFEAWEHRVSGYGGVGYQFLKMPPIDLLLKLGAGGTYEIGPPSQTLPEGYGEVQFAWKISELQRIEFSANVAPDWSNFGEFRIISRAEWQLKIDPSLDLALTMGVRWQYQSEVPAGDTNSDLRVYGGLQLGF